MSVIRDSQGRGIDSNNPLIVNVGASDVIQPVDIQAHYAQVIQTHNAVSVGASGASTGGFVKTDGFNEISVHATTSLNKTLNADIQWSLDGSTVVTAETVGADGASWIARTLPVRAPWCKILVSNKDVASQVMSAWVYLKA